MRYVLCLVVNFMILGSWEAHAQRAGYWHQEVNYVMEIDVDVDKNQFSGKQRLIYKNHSPDTLHKAFYHLYYNSFQPGSMMDVRSRTIMDPDSRVGDRIFKLRDHEIGYQKIKSLTQNSVEVEMDIQGSIMEVRLAQPILPGESAVFDMEFEAQIPVQIRRTGRDNAEGIRYSMSQWYPKMCQYDQYGWHPEPYIGREFYSTWGDFDVTIHIDPEYIVGGTGDLQQSEYYKGLEANGMPAVTSGKRTWNFVAQNVPDFVWAADPDYTFKSITAENGVVMEFLYQEGEPTRAWSDLPEIMSEVFNYADKHFGPYPYNKYAFIQGGDGGMEYPMATLITGHRPLTSLVGVSIHELMHSWYQLVLGTNESWYPWMDEGFTSYASTRIMDHLRRKGMLPGDPADFLFESSQRNYIRLVESGLEEPMTTHADHYYTNFAYGVAAYTKGALFLDQLEYIVGKEVFDRSLLRYFHTWKFKHPSDQDFIRIVEKESDMVLDWYMQYWVNSVKWIDYGIEGVEIRGGRVVVDLIREGQMPMPLDVYVTTKTGNTLVYNIPLVMMRNSKPSDAELKLTYADPWPWVNPGYTLTLPQNISLEDIQKIEVDASKRLVDVNRQNNTWAPQSTEP